MFALCHCAGIGIGQAQKRGRICATVWQTASTLRVQSLQTLHKQHQNECLIRISSILSQPSQPSRPAMAPNSTVYLTRHAQAEHNVDLDYTSEYS